MNGIIYTMPNARITSRFWEKSLPKKKNLILKIKLIQISFNNLNHCLIVYKFRIRVQKSPVGLQLILEYIREDIEGQYRCFSGDEGQEGSFLLKVAGEE